MLFIDNGGEFADSLVAISQYFRHGQNGGSEVLSRFIHGPYHIAEQLGEHVGQFLGLCPTIRRACLFQKVSSDIFTSPAMSKSSLSALPSWPRISSPRQNHVLVQAELLLLQTQFATGLGAAAASKASAAAFFSFAVGMLVLLFEFVLFSPSHLEEVE